MIPIVACIVVVLVLVGVIAWITRPTPQEQAMVVNEMNAANNRIKLSQLKAKGKGDYLRLRRELKHELELADAKRRKA